MRGSVAFRPLLFSSSMLVMALVVAAGGSRQTARIVRIISSSTPFDAHVRPHHVRCTPFPPVRCAPSLAALGAALGGCASLQSDGQPARASITPYRVEVVQGNFVSKEQVDALKPGMTPPAGARRARLAAADRRVPCRPLGLRVHDQAPGRRAAAAQHRRCSSRATCWSASRAPECRSEREFVAVDQPARGQRQGAACSKLTEEQRSRRCRCRRKPAAAGAGARSRRPARASYPPLEARTLSAAWPTAGASPWPAPSGRMGHMLIEAVPRRRRLPAGRRARRRPAARRIGNDAAAFLGHASGVPVTSRPARAAWRDAQVLIDFTRPEGTLAHLAVCRELGVQRGDRHHRLQRRRRRPQIAACRAATSRS